MRKAAPAKPYNRGGIWYLNRRVPAEFAAHDHRQRVLVSTDIRVADDPRAIRAATAVQILDRELHAYWRGKRDGREDEAHRRFEEAQRRARQIGLPYKTADELATGPLDEILRRLEQLVARDPGLEDETEVAAILGGEQRPKLLLSGLLAEVELIDAEDLALMSDEQRRKWRNPRKLAIANFSEALGQDKAIRDLTRDDTMTYRRWLQDRVRAEQIDPGTANKQIGSLSGMVKTVDRAYQLELRPIFAELRLGGEVDRQRQPWPTKFLQERLLSPGALDRLNPEARALVWLVLETGLRLSEAAALTAEAIHLDAPVPYVSVLPIGRKLKTPHSVRDVPLVGSALAAMKHFPNGFPRYRDRDRLSATVNKFFKENHLLPTPEHTLYGFRHSFEDRLTAVEAPEKVVAALMGHKWHRPKYGAGPSLEQKRFWMRKIALKPPRHFGPL